ncbi:hypothetical protein AND_008831 [Anopheles darlingi]|uniref:Uncharacterized protein n=1 Tax=Anopheles darlingi TaxID=43151 RepID=W5J6C6_ANODA|nr:hypothetical protein AND_008831 [Anopheles darlingi]
MELCSTKTFNLSGPPFIQPKDNRALNIKTLRVIVSATSTMGTGFYMMGLVSSEAALSTGSRILDLRKHLTMSVKYTPRGSGVGFI